MDLKGKICLTSSSGGHLAQLKKFFYLSNDYDVFIVTEKNPTTVNIVNDIGGYTLTQQERKGWLFFVKFFGNIFRSLFIIIRERPKVIICTGAGVTIPIILFGKLVNAKVIYIESYAKVLTPTISGRIAYKIADQFYVQWEELLNYYPKALYRGRIY
jgi:UDP-N-acetylglucosamine:LPS N-acetylglucosamine transferase